MHILPNTEDPWSSTITRFVQREFPSQSLKDGDLIDVLTDELLGTKQTRYGPKPSPESLVKIRDVIRARVALDAPLTFMVPWGSEKPNGSSIDVAELGALRTLECLSHRVKAHYAPGVQFNLRIEDVSAPHLFFTRAAEARQQAADYTSGLLYLIRILGLDSIHPVPESSLVNETTFSQEADKLVPEMQQYIFDVINNRPPHQDVLERLGWKGVLSLTTINFYLHQYAKLYPTASMESKHHILARYFAAALARSRLHIRGDDPSWNGQFIDLSFVNPIPGVEVAHSRRLYYRTLPLSYTSLHLPAWRSKGYLEITNDGEVTPKLASYNDLSTLELTPHCLTIKSLNETVHLQADYVLV